MEGHITLVRGWYSLVIAFSSSSWTPDGGENEKRELSWGKMRGKEAGATRRIEWWGARKSFAIYDSLEDIVVAVARGEGREGA